MLSMRPRRRRRRRPLLLRLVHCARVPIQTECLSRFVSIFFTHTIRTRTSHTEMIPKIQAHR